MKQLLSKARARTIRHLVLDKGTLALTIAMGGLVMLLLLGTDVLAWYWPVLLGVVSLGIGISQMRRRIPTLYEQAQVIDRRLALADSLSTAVYFSEHRLAGREQACAVQYAGAERLAVGVNLEQALPLPRPRYLLPALVLFAVASGLFVVRYLTIGSLDMNTSLLATAFDTFFASPVENAKDQSKRLNFRTGAFDPSQPDKGPNDAPVILPPDAEKGQPLLTDKDGAPQDAQKSPGDQNKNGKDEKGDDSSKKGAPQDQKDSAKGHEGEDKGDSPSRSEESRSVLDKVRDAVNNLMNKMGSKEGDQQKGKAGDKQKGQKQDKAGKGDEDNQKAEGEAQQDSDQQGDSSKADDAKQSNAPGKKPSDQAASGAGDDEGKKAIEAAKLLETMGKVSELLGERAAEIKGQVMVEVTSTKQTLRTAMTQQNATGTGNSGGEIHRDQVPLADQQFVEQYFQEVRKPSAASHAKPTGPKAGNPAVPAKQTK